MISQAAGISSCDQHKLVPSLAVADVYDERH